MIDLKNVSCCLITKDPIYPAQIIEHLTCFPFGEIQILTSCDSPHRKQELFTKAKFDTLYYQDDDCIAPVNELMEHFRPDIINCAMKGQHIRAYANKKIALIGWGSFFPKSTINVLDRYRRLYGEDFLYRRETERIMTHLSFPQNRMELPIIDLPTAMAQDRLSMQPDHYSYVPMVEQRCEEIERRFGAV